MAIWIPVTERLPEQSGDYIVTACDEGAPRGEGIWYDTVVVIASYCDGGWTWYENETEYDLSDIVTHWMPWPEPADPFREITKRVEEDKIAQMTNGDRLRSMTDEELADSLHEEFCPDVRHYHGCDMDCKRCWLSWLQKPVEVQGDD